MQSDSAEHDPPEGGWRRFRAPRLGLDVERTQAQVGAIETSLYLVVGLFLVLAGALLL